MDRIDTEAFVHLQSQSHISVTKWRQWCALYGLEPEEVVEVWDQIGCPLMVMARRVPAMPGILQLRADRRDLHILDFKEEVARLLCVFALLDTLGDEALAQSQNKSAVLMFYRRTMSEAPADTYAPALVDRFAIETCALVLIAKVLEKLNITLSGVLGMRVKRHASLAQLVGLGLRSLGAESYAGAVRACLEDACLGLAGGAGAEATDPGAVTDPEAGDLEPTRSPEPRGEPQSEDGLEPPPESEGASPALGAEGDAADGGAGGADQEADGAEEQRGGAGEDDAAAGEAREEAPDPEADFIGRFRAALRAIYREEAAAHWTIDQGEAREGMSTRVEILANFDPLHAIIPSLEEAQAVTAQVEKVQEAERVREIARQATSRAGGGSRGAARGAAKGKSDERLEDALKSFASRTARTSRMAAVLRGSGSGGSGQGPTAAPSEAGQAGGTGETDTDEAGGPGSGEPVQVVEVPLGKFSLLLAQVGRLLEAAEQGDPVVWNLYLDPETDPEDLDRLASALATEGSSSLQSYSVLREVARHLPLKGLLELPEADPPRARKFIFEVDGFIHLARTQKAGFTPDDRRLVSLEKILDHAAAALLRLETLRINGVLARDGSEPYAREAVDGPCGEILRAVAELADPGLWEQALEKASADTDRLLEAYRIELFVDALVESCRAHVQELQGEAPPRSVEDLQAALAENPLELDRLEDGEPLSPDELEALLEPSGLGDIYDAMRHHVCAAAWAVLTPGCDPPQVMARLEGMLRATMVASFVVEPVKRRHSGRPGLPLSVTSLAGLSGDAQFESLYVRVGVGGRLLFVEGFEDGTFVDLFELREYTPKRMQSSGGRGEEDTELLKTGEKYLYTVGRTNQLLGATPAEVIKGCVRDDEGNIKLFAAFRPRVSRG